MPATNHGRPTLNPWPELLTPNQAVEYYQKKHNVKTTTGTLAVKRCQGRGLPYKKIFGRVYYFRGDIDHSVDAARYIEVAWLPLDHKKSRKFWVEKDPAIFELDVKYIMTQLILTLFRKGKQWRRWIHMKKTGWEANKLQGSGMKWKKILI